MEIKHENHFKALLNNSYKISIKVSINCLFQKYEINVLVQSGAIVQVLISFMTICQHESDKIYCMTM